MAAKRLTYEDFPEGLVIPLGTKSVTREEVIEFASEFDPQPFHLDEAAGKASILGGLAASGWHTCAMLMRLICDAYLTNSTSQGSPGLDHVKWKKPLLVGDTLTGTSTVISARLSRSRPGLGIVTVRTELANQRGEPVIEVQHVGMMLTREAAA